MAAPTDSAAMSEEAPAEPAPEAEAEAAPEAEAEAEAALEEAKDSEDPKQRLVELVLSPTLFQEVAPYSLPPPAW